MFCEIWMRLYLWGFLGEEISIRVVKTACESFLSRGSSVWGVAGVAVTMSYLDIIACYVSLFV